MLSRKTLGVAGAAILGSMALLATNPVNADIRLTPDAAAGETAGKVKIARETLMTTTAGTTTVRGVKYYNIANAGGVLDIVADRGIVAGAAAVYYRLTLENMVLVAAPDTVTAGGTSAGAAIATVAGGAANDNYLVFSVAGAGAATDDMTVPTTTLGVRSNMPGNLKLEVYRNAFDAQAGVRSIASLMKTMSGAITVADGISERGTPGMAVADASEGFMQLTEGDTARIGRLRITADTGAHSRASEPVTLLSDMLNNTSPITVTFKGDFSVGTYSLDPEADCNGVVGADGAGNVLASSVGDEGDMEDVKLTPSTPPDAAADVSWYLCVTVPEDNDMALPSGAFTATVKYAALEDRMGRAEQTLTIGSIGRTGTTVHIPFLTVNERYHQRLVIINRGPEASYNLRFLMEDGRTATPGADASGMLQANEVTVLSLHNDDVVTIVGGTRTSATLSIEADPTNISVSTVIHSPTTANTDTVLLKR